MRRSLSLGYSPCPNDTFMFHGLVHGEVADCAGLDFEVAMEDIESLNRRSLDAGQALQVQKLSLPALAHSLDRFVVLDAGAALGRGCGPLVVNRRGEAGDLNALAGRRVAIPGAYTTAHLLLRIFGPDLEAVEMRFERIMPAVTRGEVDAGLIIHESRFTYADHGLQEVADLGVCWEDETGLPLPLGLIAGQRSLGTDLLRQCSQGLASSVAQAFARPERAWDYVRAHSQEMDETVCRQHISLYVNEFSKALGAEGRRAVEELLARGRAVGHLPAGGSPFA